jgi:membrane protein DedA with SNARE-associated domain
MGLFLLATLAGSLLWVTVLTFLGRALGAGYGQVSQFTGPYGEISRLLLLALAAVAVITLIMRSRRRSGSRLPP